MLLHIKNKLLPTFTSHHFFIFFLEFFFLTVRAGAANIFHIGLLRVHSPFDNVFSIRCSKIVLNQETLTCI